ncbi:beta-glucoside operon transcriptional antiterminator [Clostridium acetobutylicum]|uniref:Transcriptional antiterminator licT n=2 Tax=Clostridium acetobutylicum TaxID=1488 RepID=Q7D470_CLOAB|nr:MULTISPECIES: PRD domain-containing protein [Clostridium]AAF35838.1 ScrT [Clostridium acetobutylicum ATCC 824]AAK78402.1 Transcriptional antiterminator licT [Clostridium acetobutylicum ATCC 824]ADZ19472.1 Transcriptional antiterminator licT [Clostridium acetobutylicum EA 2018]AEI34737.1 transcriptional antiterminator licT [Clostridium acetobutylicum DSM 1731]AWV80125.1 PRD domain-containing protein [Clostridium acetobutylicum]
MVIKKILNNSAVTTIDDATRIEKVIMGKGIAFQKKPGDILNEEKIEKIFSIENQNENLKFQSLISEIPIEHIKVSENIISYAKRKLDVKFDEHIYISLTDHLSFAFRRYSKGIKIKNNMLWDIKRIYKKEYNIGMWAVEYIKGELGIKMDEDEAGFIALHIIDASLNESMDNTINITEIIDGILNIIKYFFSIEFNEDDMSYDRLLTHLKYFAQRVVSRKNAIDEEEKSFLEIVKTNYKEAYRCVGKIKSFIEKNYDYEVKGGEIVYLTLHVQRVISSLRDK